MIDKEGTTVSKFLKLKAKISAKTKEVDSLKKEAALIENEIIELLETKKLERFDVKAGSVTLKKTFMGNCKDKKKLFEYATKKKAMQLLDIRLSQAAYREMIEDGVKLPFIDKFNNKKLLVGHKRNV